MLVEIFNPVHPVLTMNFIFILFKCGSLMFVSQNWCFEELLPQSRLDKYFMSGSWGALLQKNAFYSHCTIWVIELQDKS